MTKSYWLMKSEPDVFSIDDLKKRTKSTEHWDVVRNYQARNFMKEMKLGDLVLFYHSNATPPGVAGIAEVVKLAYPDHTQFDKKSKYYDPKATKENPRWFMVEVKFIDKFKRFIALDELKKEEPLQEMRLLQKGNRLSVMPVRQKEFNYICKMGKDNSSG